MKMDGIDIGSLVSGVGYLVPELIITLTILLIIIQDLVRRNAIASLTIFALGIATSLVYVTSVTVATDPWSTFLTLDTGSSITKWIIGLAGFLPPWSWVDFSQHPPRIF